jgi:hypothetical protein
MISYVYVLARVLLEDISEYDVWEEIRRGHDGGVSRWPQEVRGDYWETSKRVDRI